MPEKRKFVSISTADRRWLLLNYGGFLQHYALRIVLKRLGYEPYRVETANAMNEIGAFIVPPLRTVVNNLLSIFCTSRQWRKGGVIFYLTHRFRFLVDYWRLIGSVFERQRKDERVGAIVGGGQAWSLRCQDRPDLYWEDDERPMKRIAYSVSSSWTRSVNDENWRFRLVRACRKATAVSLREPEGVEVCNSLCPGVGAVVMSDPVFLLSRQDYEDVVAANRIFKKRTLWCYFLEVRTRTEIDIAKLCQLASALGMELKITCIQGAERYVPDRLRLDPSPSDYIRCLRDCECFITNSFHGTAFAIVFNKMFAYVRQQENTANVTGCNERQMALINQYGFGNRVVSIGDNVENLAKIITRPIDWKAVNARRMGERERSLMWLKASLDSRTKGF